MRTKWAQPEPQIFKTMTMMKGIEVLPTSIFQIIQTYVRRKDYNELMNCNRSTFQQIKYETIFYNLILPDRWSKVIPDLESSFGNFIKKRVKDPLRQIMILMDNPPLHFLEPYSYLFLKYPCKVIIDNDEFEIDDFNIFNNIYHVSLSTSEDIEIIESGFENVKILEINNFENLISISNINQSKTLEKVIIKNCMSCTEIDFPLDNCISLTIESTAVRRFRPLLPKIKRLHFSCQPLIHILPLDVIDILRLSTIEYAKIDARLPEGFDFTVFQNIPELALNHFKPPLTTFPSASPFLPFYGKHLLYIEGDMSLWGASSFTNLRRLDLARCNGVIDFQMMPELRQLLLSDSDAFQTIPSLPKLSYLYLARCEALVSIVPSQPSLHTLHINQCKKFKHLPDLRQQTMRFVRINRCDSVSDLSRLGKVVVLEIDSCDEIKSSEGLDSEQIGKLIFRKSSDRLPLRLGKSTENIQPFVSGFNF